MTGTVEALLVSILIAIRPAKYDYFLTGSFNWQRSSTEHN